MAKKPEKFIQIGTGALRDPRTGDFGPSFGLYMKATDEALASRQRVIEGMGRIFADMIRQYEVGCEEEGIVI